MSTDSTFICDFITHSHRIERTYIDTDGYTVSTDDDILEETTIGSEPPKSAYDNDNKEKKYRSVRCVLLTNTDIYLAILDFDIKTGSDVTFTGLKIITGRTEAGVNRIPGEPYSTDENARFEFLNYYDSDYIGDYKLVYGEVLPWDDTAAAISPEDIKNARLSPQNEWEGRPIEEFIEHYGRPAASFATKYGYEMLFYPTEKDGEYWKVVYELDRDTLINEISVTDEIGSGSRGLYPINSQ